MVFWGRTKTSKPEVHSKVECKAENQLPLSKFLDTAEAYFACHISPNFQISLSFAFIVCPYDMMYDFSHLE